MVAELRNEQQGLTTETVARWVQTYVDQERKPLEAARLVLRDIRESGLEADLLALLGPEWIFYLWSEQHPRSNRRQRPAGVEPTPITMPPARRVDTSKLQESASLLEGLQKVGDVWVRVGDLTGAQCRIVARQLKSQALEVAHRARYYHALGQALGEKEQVRQRFTETDLIRLYDEAGRS